MISTIETQAAQLIIDLEESISLISSLSYVASSLSGADQTEGLENISHLSHVLSHLSAHLDSKFGAYYVTVSRDVLPSVPDTKKLIEVHNESKHL
jgi:hypothetical protein